MRRTYMKERRAVVREEAVQVGVNIEARVVDAETASITAYPVYMLFMTLVFTASVGLGYYWH